VDDIFQRSEQLLLQDLPDLLPQMGFDISRTVRRAPIRVQKSILGTIGFGGTHMRGALSLLGEVGVWEAGCPAELRARPNPERVLADFVGEVCNVVGGRFRSRLLRIGVEIACALPTTINGWDITMPCALAAATTWYELRTSAGILHLRYDMTVEESFVLDTEAKVESLDTNLVFF
jgi:hypothetical protein